MQIPRVWKLSFWISFTLITACLALVLTFALTVKDAEDNPRWAAERLLERAEPMWKEMALAFRQGTPPAELALPTGDPLPTLRAMASYPLVDVAFHCTPDHRLTVLRAGADGGPLVVDLKTWRPETYTNRFNLTQVSRDPASQKRLAQDLLIKELVEGYPFAFRSDQFDNAQRPTLFERGEPTKGWLGYRLSKKAFIEDEGDKVLKRHSLLGAMDWRFRDVDEYYPIGRQAHPDLPYALSRLALHLDWVSVLTENLAVQMEALYAYLALTGALLISSLGTSRQIRAILDERALAMAQSDFVSGVSHEMRTPLTTIKMYAEMVEQGLVEGPEKQSHYMRTIGQECDRLTRLIENVLDYARISGRRREYRFEPLDARSLIDEAVASLEGPLAQAGMRVDVVAPEHLPVVADRDAVVQALINMIGNAIKYAPGEKRILVTAGAEGETVRLDVRDFGPGVPRCEQRKIFQPFYRVGSELTRQTTGSGLGLALVQEYARAHRGRVELVSKQGEGATFALVLPRGRKS